VENAKRCGVHALAAYVVVLSDSSVLLVQLTNPPAGHPGWCLPGDALRHGEHPENCVARILTEQFASCTGLIVLM